LLFSFIGGILFYTLTDHQSKKQYASNNILSRFQNNASKVEYSFNLNNGKLHLIADNIVVLQKDKIDLDYVVATYTVNDKKIIIESGLCSFRPYIKKIYLTKNIKITSDKINLQTKEAVIDITNQTINSDSGVLGSNSGISFTCSGFLIKKDGKIVMKNVKVKAKKKLKLH
jgi:hypothetical protein